MTFLFLRRSRGCWTSSWRPSRTPNPTWWWRTCFLPLFHSWVKIDTAPTELARHSSNRGSSHRRNDASNHIQLGLALLLAYRSWEGGGLYLLKLFLFLPAFAMLDAGCMESPTSKIPSILSLSNLFFPLLSSRVSDPHWFNADPD